MSAKTGNLEDMGMLQIENGIQSSINHLWAIFPIASDLTSKF
jgi:hypothetical protein